MIQSQLQAAASTPRRGNPAAGPPPADADTVVDAAVAEIAAALRGTVDGLPSLAGAAGRLATGDDLRLHVRFLLAATETSAPSYYADFLRWQLSVMAARGLPAAMLETILEALSAVVLARLGADLRPRAEAVVAAGREALDAPAVPADRLYHAHLPEPSPHAERLAGHLVAGDAAACRSLAQAEARRTRSYLHVAVRLFQPALYRVGLMWQQNEISVAQEHMATAIVQTLLAQVYAGSLFTPPIGRRALFAAIEGNRHAVGLRMVSDAYELAGWSVRYLGADTPTEGIVSEVVAWRPHVVGLSASMAEHLPAVRGAVGALRDALADRCPTLVIGGLAVNQIDDIWRWTGADAWSPDAEQGVKAAA